MHLPWRFGLFLLLCATMAPLALVLPGAFAVMAGFDVAALTFLVSLVPLFGRDHGEMRAAARRNEANRGVMLLVSAIVSLVVLVLVASELGEKTAPTAPGLALILATLALAWTFSNMIYTLHYADIYYSADEAGKDRAGLDFPDTPHPDYWDFVYFAFTLGMTFQTSDVSMTNTAVRRIATAHSIAAFVFNLGIVAFTINVLGN